MSAGSDSPDSAPAPRLAARRLALMRGGRLLLSGVDFTLGPGEALMLTGPNGIGKSSLLRLIAGLLPRFAGDLEREGEVGLLDDRLALDAELPLGRALALWSRIDHGARGDELLADAMADFDLAGLADVPVRMLSTGQRKRAALARLVASDAPIWLLDEPASGLDSANLERLARRVQDHLARGGIALIVSHQRLPVGEIACLDLSAHRPKEAA